MIRKIIRNKKRRPVLILIPFLAALLSFTQCSENDSALLKGSDLIPEFNENETEILEFSCKICNRWGEEIAQLNSISDTWDGIDNNGNDLTGKVCLYNYTSKDNIGTEFRGTGTIQIKTEGTAEVVHD